MLEIRLLGPIEACLADKSIALGGTKPRALLAALVLERGHVVSATRLVDVVWPDDPPDTARSLIQTYVSTLRKSFAGHGFPDLIATRPPGYVLRPGPATVDVDVFEGLVSDARRRAESGDHRGATELLRRAISLWRGPALSGLEASPLAAEARRLDEMHLAALEERFEVELRLGRVDHVAELTGLVSRHPTNERLRGQLMMTLYRMGRQAEALACYREGREALIDELGVEPGAELTALHSTILRGDGDAGRVGMLTAAPLAQAVVPAQIPPAPADFTGRHQDAGKLIDALVEPSPGTHIVAGPGGSGKSALATYAAHHVASSFPDGQLCAQLRGMSDSPATAAEVLGGFLRALGMDAARLPESTQERMELFRSLVAERRMLILLDDAANEQQVRPLLPGGSRCAVLVTSRDRLAGLSGASLIELDVLSPDEAWELLGRVVGAQRLSAHPAAVTRILQACEHLPLAIRIAGARLATRRNLPLEVLADRLADERQRLNELSAGDLAVRSSIGLSYRALDEPARMALRRMGYFGIPEFSAWVVAWLMDIDETEAERLLESLVDAQLVTFTGLDRVGVLRYRLHDLVRLYARERAEADEPAEALTDSIVRALGGWLALVNRIAANSPPAEIVWRQASAPALEVSGEIVDRVLTNAAGWLQSEEASLAVAVERAAAIGLHGLVCDFVSARIAVELEGANRFEFRARIIDASLAAARHAGDLHAEAAMLAELAHLYYDRDIYGEARRHFNEALSRCRALHDVRGQAAALAGLGAACREPGRLTEAIHFLNQAAALLQALEDYRGIGYVLRLRGSVLLEQGKLEAARSDLDTSMNAYQVAGSRHGLAYTLRTLSLYHRASGDYTAALKAGAESAAIFKGLGDELMLSYAVRAHAKAQIRAGMAAEALPRLEWALSVARNASDRWGQACTLRVLGQLHLGEDRLDLAQTCLDAAMSLWDSMDAVLWRARTLHDLSLLHRRRGDLDAARAAFEPALKTFHDHGAREYAELAGPTAQVTGGLKRN